MRTKKINLFAFLFVVGIFTSNAQEDRHFSMFYGNTLELNPAASGMYPAKMQAFTNYRNQWSAITPSLVRTISASVNGRLYEVGSGDSFLGGGLSFYSDVSGVGKMKTTALRLSTSYAVEIQKDQFLSGGVQIGMLQRSVNFNNFTWSSQWDGQSFDSGILSGENLIGATAVAFDVNAGVYYFGKINEMLTLNGGIAAHHLTKPKIGVVVPDERLYRKYVINAGADIAISHSKLGLSPHFFAFMQGPNKEITFGNDFKYFIKESSKYTGYYDETSIALGFYYRTQDAMYSTLMFNMAGFSVGVSYDFTTSDLNKANNGLGGMEVMLRYRVGFKGHYSSFR